MNATELVNGTTATVKKLSGTSQFIAKMASMGIFPGSVIRKKSSSIMGGPIVIEKGTTQLAIGHKSAKNIIVVEI
jgi:Fe2+ transport system protein FeoA